MVCPRSSANGATGYFSFRLTVPLRIRTEGFQLEDFSDIIQPVAPLALERGKPPFPTCKLP